MTTDMEYIICPYCGQKNGYGSTRFEDANNGDEQNIICDNPNCYKEFKARIVMTVEFETETIDE
jgi:hypothetical protein